MNLGYSPDRLSRQRLLSRAEPSSWDKRALTCCYGSVNYGHMTFSSTTIDVEHHKRTTRRNVNVRVPGVVVLRQMELCCQVVRDLLQGLATSLGHTEVVEEHGTLQHERTVDT